LENIKTQILDYISLEKKQAVEPLVDKVISFYKENIILELTESSISYFERAKERVNAEQATPRGKITLSSTMNTEEALVHELLHLYMPIHHGIYTLGFDIKDKGTYELSAITQNLIEHDIFIKDYLNFGYSMDRFLTPDNKRDDYEAKIRSGIANDLFWMHEYFRIFITKRHVPKHKLAEWDKRMNIMRANALKMYPNITDKFTLIRNWIKSEDFHKSDSLFKEIKSLFAIFGIYPPTQILTHDKNYLLNIVRP